MFVDNLSGAYDGVNALIEAGHRKISIITGPETSKPGKERLKGYMNALVDAGIEIRPEYIVSGNFKTDKAYQCTKQLLELPDPPTAIFSSNNMTTLGCLKYFTENKIKMGKQISLIGFDDIELLRLIAFPVSAISRDARQQGIEAMQLMLKRLQDKTTQTEPERLNVPYQVILRGTERI